MLLKKMFQFLIGSLKTKLSLILRVKELLGFNSL